MSWTMRVRRIHRWLSIAFTLAVLANVAAMAVREPPLWLGLLALAPLVVLLLTGLWMFFQPLAVRGRGAGGDRRSEQLQ